MRAVLVPMLALILAGCVTSHSGRPDSKGSPAEAARINYELGAEYMRQGNLELARERLERAVSQDPDLAAARSALALVYDKQGDTELADDQYRSAVRLAPDDASVQNTYAVFLCQRRRYDDAVEYFSRAAANGRYGTPAAALTNAGVCLLQKPDPVAAEGYFRRALQRNPGYNEALLQMAALSLERGNALRARAFVQRYLDQHPPSPEILWVGLRAERALGDTAAAARYAADLRERFPSSVEALTLIEGSDGG
ncbi:MAG: type IV pilus biogenesis/stability protein PilW [Gammaproteobacteria bacterium]